MKTTISLVRHGLVHNPNKIYYGRLTGFGLADTGRAQVVLTGRFLANWPIAAVYHSPMQRALETAEIIAAQLPTPSPLIETEHLNEVYTRFDGWPETKMDERGWDLYTGEQPPYEQPNVVLARLLAFFAQALAAFPGQHVLGVTHGDLVNFAIQWGAGLPVQPKRNLVDECGVEESYPSQACVAMFDFEGEQLVGKSYHSPAKPRQSTQVG